MLKLRAILAAGFFVLSTAYALAASVIWQTAPTQIRTSTGAIASGAKAFFYLAGTTTDYTVFTDNAQTVPHPQPVVANSNGVFSAVYVPYTSTGYRVRVTTSAGVVISDFDGIANPAPPSGGGGGGITVSVEQVLQPGWTMFLPQSGVVTGFVRMNGRTIGNATSGASERANADTANLYTYIWTNCADAQCPVSTGRGGSAAADYAANKTITLTDMRGRAPFGLADMGNSTSTRLDGTTFGSGNKTTPNSSGGADTHTLTTAQMPSHTHTQDAHSHTSNAAAQTTGVDNSQLLTTVSTPQSQATSSTTATNQNTGGGLAHPIMNPFVLGGWYQKL